VLVKISVRSRWHHGIRKMREGIIYKGVIFKVWTGAPGLETGELLSSTLSLKDLGKNRKEQSNHIEKATLRGAVIYI
jgi:hypothetical protein